MIPASFDYLRAASVAEAVRALAGSGSDSGSGDASVLAGGQSLIPLLRLRLARPALLIDIGRLSELGGITDLGDTLEIGALTTHHTLMTDPLIGAHCGLLARVAATVADPAIRNRGTLGGSLCHADPAADLPAAIVALDAELVAAGPEGSRTIPAADFFTGYLSTALRPGEILTGIRVPKLGQGWGFGYRKFQVTAQDWAVVAVAALVHRQDGQVTAARIGFANMGATPVRAGATELAAAGATADTAALRSAAASADDGTDPPSDLRADAGYRRHLARVLTARALADACGLPGNGR